MNNKAHLRPKDYDSNGDIIPSGWKEEKGDLISRSELKRHKFLSPDPTRAYDETTIAYKKGWNDAIDEIIDNAPTVYPKQGEWKDVMFADNGIGVGTCNQCGIHRIIDKFCPNCGADMRGT